MTLDLARCHRALIAERCRRDFAFYLRTMWPVIEPTRALLPSVAIDALTAALGAVGAGRIRRLAIGCPPGVSKSIVSAIAWPTWLLLRTGGRARVMTGSYSHDLAARDARRSRDVVTSPLYTELTRGAWFVRDDANRAGDWWTTTSGRRLTTSTGSKATGERSGFQILDDVLSGADIHSEAARKEARRWLSEVMPSRLEDSENDPRVLIGQRLHVEDPIGLAIDQGWKYLCLPAVLAEGDEPCVLVDDAGVEVWRDPRAPGEPLVSLLGHDALARLKVELGSTAYSAQYMQRCADDTDAVIRRTWWRWYGSGARPAGCSDAPSVELPAISRVALGVDLTFGSATGDYATIAAWGAHGSGRYFLDGWRERAGFERQLEMIQRFAARWPGCRIVLEKAANGAAALETLRRVIPGIVAEVPRHSKAARLSLIAPTVESGCAYLPAGHPLSEVLVEEATLSGSTKHDDMADASAYAILALNREATYVEPAATMGGSVDDYYDFSSEIDDPIWRALSGEDWR